VTKARRGGADGSDGVSGRTLHGVGPVAAVPPVPPVRTTGAVAAVGPEADTQPETVGTPTLVDAAVLTPVPEPPRAARGGDVRGRVIARSGRELLVRASDGDVRVNVRGTTMAQPGDLIEIRNKALQVVRAYVRGDYPTPETEMMRLEQGRRRNLVKRATAMAALRGFFTARGFLEVDTPVLVRSPGLEVHLAAVPGGSDGRGWLITSPEYQMKRLLAAGLEKIYTVCKCFRAGEEGGHHSSEFTMLEWYRGWAELAEIQRDTEELVAAVAMAVRGKPVVRVWGEGGQKREIDVTPPWPVMTVAEAMERFAGVRVRGDETAAELRREVVAAGIDVGTATAWDDVFFCAFVQKVDPALAMLDRPLFLVDWPVPLAALARRKPGNPAVAERFEAYVGGIELANAFGELTDPVEQRARFEDDLAHRGERGLPRYPVDEKLIAALEEGLPPSAGIALGVDRLVMLVSGAARIRDVLTFAADEL
jgi:elongation factor P--(R)-beta-lysine ligase